MAEKPLLAAFLLYGENRESKVAWKLLYKIIDTEDKKKQLAAKHRELSKAKKRIGRLTP